MALDSGNKVLFCGLEDERGYMARAIAAKMFVTAIDNSEARIRAAAQKNIEIMRGSTSVIPVRENTYDVAVAINYLHEVDPSFHVQIATELGRVARRVVVVEPAPPSDAFGKRLAGLYSRAKRDIGQFEFYQTLDYWKKLVSGVKAEIGNVSLAFPKAPPADFLDDTVRLIIDAMRVEAAPQEYLDELEQIAATSTGAILPPARFIITGANPGEMPVSRVSDDDPAVVAARPRRGTTRQAEVITGDTGAPGLRALAPSLVLEQAEPTVVQRIAAARPLPFQPAAPPLETVAPFVAFAPGSPAASAAPSPAQSSVPSPAPVAPPAAAPAPSFGPGAVAFSPQRVGINAPNQVAAAPMSGASPVAANPFGLPPMPQKSAAAGPGWQWEPPENEASAEDLS